MVAKLLEGEGKCHLGSPDLMTNDFCFWRLVKEKVCAPKPHIIMDLKTALQNAFEDIGLNANVCKAVRLSVTDLFRNV